MIIRRWEEMTGKSAILVAPGRAFEEVEEVAHITSDLESVGHVA